MKYVGGAVVEKSVCTSPVAVVRFRVDAGVLRPDVEVARAENTIDARPSRARTFAATRSAA